MLRRLFTLALGIQAGLTASVEHASSPNKLHARQHVDYEFGPTLEPFLSLTLSVYFPSNVSTPFGLQGSAPNCRGGKATGAFEADILPIGAGFEHVFRNEHGEFSVCSYFDWT